MSEKVSDLPMHAVSARVESTTSSPASGVPRQVRAPRDQDVSPVEVARSVESPGLRAHDPVRCAWSTPWLTGRPRAVRWATDSDVPPTPPHAPSEQTVSTTVAPPRADAAREDGVGRRSERRLREFLSERGSS